MASKQGSSIAAGVRRQSANLLKTGKRYDKFDQIRQRHFWSSYFFAPDPNGYIPANRYTLFTTPVGSNGQGFPSGAVITERESNWKSQNRVPDNQNFEINELGCAVMGAAFAFTPQQQIAAVTPPNAGALSNFFQSALLSITYLTNSVPLGLLADFAQSSGPFFGINNQFEDSIYHSVVSNGLAAPALRRKFKIPILLQAGESFNFTIEVPRPVFVGVGGDSPEGKGPFLVRMDFFATESFVEKS